MREHLLLKLQWLASRLTRLALGSRVKALVVESRNGVFAIDPEDCGVGRQLRFKGEYGQHEIERLLPRLDSESAVLVVGAHIGSLAIPLSRFCRTVTAIEANPDTFELLSLNIHLNSARNCVALHLAANDATGVIEMVLNRANSGGSKRLPLVRDYKYFYDAPKTAHVQAKPLDDALSNQRFDMVIMDIEGSEYFALKGMQRILGECKTLVVEFLPHHLRNIGGIGVQEFLNVIEPHFLRLTVPSLQRLATKNEFASTLQAMYDLDQGDEGIIFEK